MEPTDARRAAARPAPLSTAAEIERVSLQLSGQLAQRGIDVHEQDGPAERADMLIAVEAFERAVRARGGDSFVNSLRSSDPERRDYVLPRRGADQSARDYIASVQTAASRLGVPPE